MTTLHQLRGLLDGKPDLLRGQVLRVEGEWADVATANGLQKVRCTLPPEPAKPSTQLANEEKPVLARISRAPREAMGANCLERWCRMSPPLPGPSG